MALSDAERRTLARVVGRCRELLDAEVRDQIERIYGFTREGAPRPLEGLPLSSVERSVAEELREWHRHLAAMATGTSEARQLVALNRMVEETAFTVLHRLAALRMAEERDVLKPCVREGLRSDGFRLYLQFAGGALGRDEVLARCRTERDLAIAHGREDLYAPPAGAPARRGRGRRRGVQLGLPHAGEDDDA
ncbi:MAG: hypothetical protein HY744_34250 [Deltaproteobacteria bacterium]|nr:hypothetical protein [Deltaproteobacteria bacterium]